MRAGRAFVRSFAAVALAAIAAGGASCGGGLFDPKIEVEYACSTTGGCPTGYQCVPGERICRQPCVTPQTTVGTGGTANDNGCRSGNNKPYICDLDRFCRPGCAGFSGSSSCDASSCAAGEVCDFTNNVCRKACGNGCATGFGCIGVADSGPAVTSPSVCLACKPGVTAGVITPPVFAAEVDYATAGRYTIGVAIGDLAGSGRPSVVAVDDSMHLDVFANNGDGTLQAPPVVISTGMAPSGAVGLADFTGDGKIDVVAAVLAKVLLYPGNGDGTLGAAVSSPMQSSTGLVVGDFSGDGKPDLAVNGAGTGETTVLTGDGAGGLKKLSTVNQTGANYHWIVAADFDADGKLDYGAAQDKNTVDIYFNTGGGVFNNARRLGVGIAGDILTAAGFDANGDGKADVVALRKNQMTGSGASYLVTVALNDGKGTMFGSTAMNYAIPGGNGMAVADFDGDGRLDLAFADNAPPVSQVYILMSDGAGGFVFASSIKMHDGPTAITAGDLDGDGKPDLAVAIGGGGVAVLLNQTTPMSKP